MTFDGKAFGKDVVETTKAYIDKTVAPLLKQIEALQAEIAEMKAKPAPKDIDVEAVVDSVSKRMAPMLKEAVAAIPLPKDGKDGAAGAKGDAGEPGQAGRDGIDGKNGADLVGTLMIDRKGALIHTLADGSVRDLGIVVGKDADMGVLERLVAETSHKAVAEAVAAIPAPKDGAPGPQGERGLGLTVDDVEPLIKHLVENATADIPRAITQTVKDEVAKLPLPANGKDADPALVASLVKETVERAVAALPVAKDGQSVTVDDVRPLIEAEVTKAVTGLPAPKDGVDGKSVTLDDVQPFIAEEISKAVSAIPVPKDGASVTVADVAPMILTEVEKATADIPRAVAQTVEDEVAKLPPPAAGKDADPEVIKRMVADAVSALPPAQDGKDGVTIEELRPVIDETVAKAVSAIPIPKDGRDGLDVKDLLVVEGGELVATFTDGRTKVLGQFRGKDGDPGKDGANGTDGKNGADAIGFDDLTEELEDDGRIIVRQFFHAGQMVKETRITTKTPIFRGVHDHARTYLPGDMVTRGGSVWHCDVECQGPFNGDHFTLSAKKGRDAKAAD
jgi:hypothetical protein